MTNRLQSQIRTEVLFVLLHTGLIEGFYFHKEREYDAYDLKKLHQRAEAAGGNIRHVQLCDGNAAVNMRLLHCL